MRQDIGTHGRPYTRRTAWLQRRVTDLHTLAYRLSGGRIGGTLVGMPMLLLTTWGRKTGLPRTAPLLYLPIDGVFILVASNGGAQRSPTWWFNLQARPEALIQIDTVRGRVRARSATDEERERYWPKLLEVYQQYHDYQQRTDRVIPLVILEPIDHGLLDAAKPYERA